MSTETVESNYFSLPLSERPETIPMYALKTLEAALGIRHDSEDADFSTHTVRSLVRMAMRLSDMERELAERSAMLDAAHDARDEALRQNAALREAQATVFKIAMDCINGRISDAEALQRLEAHSQGSGNG